MWTQGDAPLAYVKRILCREYHCMPHELKQVPLRDIIETLTILRIENEITAAKIKMASQGK